MPARQDHYDAVSTCLHPGIPEVEPQLCPALSSANTLSCCTGYDEAAAKSFLQSSVEQQVQQQWTVTASEQDLQARLGKLVPQTLSKCHAKSRQYWDTSGKSVNCALPVLQCNDAVDIATSILASTQVPAGSGLRGTELRLDCTI